MKPISNERENQLINRLNFNDRPTHSRSFQDNGCKENIGQCLDLKSVKPTSHSSSVLQPLNTIPFQERNIQNCHYQNFDAKLTQNEKESLPEKYENELHGEEVSQQVRQSLLKFLKSNTQDTVKEIRSLHIEQEEVNLADEVNLEFLSDDSDTEESTPKIQLKKIFLADLIQIEPIHLSQPNSGLADYRENLSTKEPGSAPDNSQNKVKINLSSLFNI
ncbi:unnamed protein product [Moneuplotes crassus]|uniref:Uncharacterized protein n=1 Tax=Euplotes crassus TaxID=5936 RepID=A0AAD1XNP8_EUPCR|nr:unnamed protein product [Moneuplotes crassus]